MKNKILKLQDFIILWAGQTISQFGSAIMTYALIIWAYQKQGTVMSVSLLSACTYIPYVLVSIFAGTVIDRMRKKPIILMCDAVASAISAIVLILLFTSQLKVYYLYGFNFILGLMNSLQSPASNVAITLITPEKYYAKASGIQSTSSSLISIFSPILATAIFSTLGIKVVVTVGLITFLIYFVTILLLVKIDDKKAVIKTNKDSFWQQNKQGLKYVLQNKGILYLMLFMSIINLLASISYSSILAPMILSRSGGGLAALATVSASIGIGGIVGGLFVTLTHSPQNKVKTIFICCAFSMLFGDILLGSGRNAIVWSVAMILGNLPLPFLNAAEIVFYRERIPIELQGRTFSIRSALQFGTIPLGYILGGILADYMFEPLMMGSSNLQRVFSIFVGTGSGAGMASMFLLTGIFGAVISILFLKNRHIRELDKSE